MLPPHGVWVTEAKMTVGVCDFCLSRYMCHLDLRCQNDRSLCDSNRNERVSGFKVIWRKAEVFEFHEFPTARLPVYIYSML